VKEVHSPPEFVRALVCSINEACSDKSKTAMNKNAASNAKSLFLDFLSERAN
jgi:hypothetical protein